MENGSYCLRSLLNLGKNCSEIKHNLAVKVYLSLYFRNLFKNTHDWKKNTLKFCSFVFSVKREIQWCFRVNKALSKNPCRFGPIGWEPGSTRFRDSSAQNHFGPGLLGPDVSAHFQSGTARPTLVGPLVPFLFFFSIFFFLGGGWGWEGGNLSIYCFILFMCIKKYRPLGRFKTYVTSTFFKALVVMD